MLFLTRKQRLKKLPRVRQANGQRIGNPIGAAWLNSGIRSSECLLIGLAQVSWTPLKGAIMRVEVCPGKKEALYDHKGDTG